MLPATEQETQAVIDYIASVRHSVWVFAGPVSNMDLALTFHVGLCFPVTEGGAKCVLCQQDLDHAAANRLKGFEEFVISKTEKELRQVREEFARRRDAFSSLKMTTDAVEETVNELRLPE